MIYCFQVLLSISTYAATTRQGFAAEWEATDADPERDEEEASNAPCVGRGGGVIENTHTTDTESPPPSPPPSHPPPPPPPPLSSSARVHEHALHSPDGTSKSCSDVGSTTLLQGMTVTAAAGEITDGPANYEDNAECTWTVVPSDGAHPIRLGKAVQVQPMKPMLKASGATRLKLKYDTLLSSFPFNLNLRPYASSSPALTWSPITISSRCTPRWGGAS